VDDRDAAAGELVCGECHYINPIMGNSTVEICTVCWPWWMVLLSVCYLVFRLVSSVFVV